MLDVVPVSILACNGRNVVRARAFVLVAPAAASVLARVVPCVGEREECKGGALGGVCSGESMPLSRVRPRRSRVRALAPALAVVQQRPGLAPDPDVHVLRARGCAVCESETDAGSAKAAPWVRLRRAAMAQALGLVAHRDENQRHTGGGVGSAAMGWGRAEAGSQRRGARREVGEEDGGEVAPAPASWAALAAWSSLPLPASPSCLRRSVRGG